MDHKKSQHSIYSLVPGAALLKTEALPPPTYHHRKVGRENIINVDKQSHEFLTPKLRFHHHMEITYTL